MLKWIPWQFVARRAARAYGFADPIQTLQRVRSFSQPSESAEPIELLRAGFAFHARGLVNTKAIQTNLDWVWPYWVQRQFDPDDESFVPRAFSFSHINLTHRNWTAVGLPDSERYAIVDPRGLVTPFHDSWSLDFAILAADGTQLFPSQLKREIDQSLTWGDDSLCLRSHCAREGNELTTWTRMLRDDDGHHCLQIHVTAEARAGGRLAVSLRPYNPEGIQFIDSIDLDTEKSEWLVNDEVHVSLPQHMDEARAANYERGDILRHLDDTDAPSSVRCPAGMATAAATVPIEKGGSVQDSVRIPVDTVGPARGEPERVRGIGWEDAVEPTAKLVVPDRRMRDLYDGAVRALILLSPHDIYPGPYTYRRFWFRDACIIAHAMLAAGLKERVFKAFSHFPKRQTLNGYFRSQEGEWDSNGQVLWIWDRYEILTGEPLPPDLGKTISKAVDWIARKRLPRDDRRHGGLLPPGFSAEHFGPNDYYYWDDFWSVAGLQGAASMLGRRGEERAAEHARNEAEDLMSHIQRSLDAIPERQARGGVPASPYRRLDSGAIGALVADYPLQLSEPGDERMIRTANYLWERCLRQGAFFQDMIHSGLNIYLTLDLAQTFLRCRDPRWKDLMKRCAELATPTGQWPEAIHPRTLGGCMGDGQHGWAAAEWVMFLRNAFLREEGDDTLVVGSGLMEDWLAAETELSFGPTPTPWGEYHVRFDVRADRTIDVELSGGDPERRGQPQVRIEVPGYQAEAGKGLARARLKPKEAFVEQ